MNQVKKLAQRISAERNQPEVMWSLALGKLAGLVDLKRLQEEQMEWLATAALSPRQLLILVDYAARGSPEESTVTALMERVDESDYSLSEWLEAIETFNDWISSQGRTTTLEMMLGYISCSTEANANTACLQSLKDTVGAMLEDYGFIG